MLAPCPTDRPPALEQQHLEWIMSDKRFMGCKCRVPRLSAGGKRKQVSEGLQHQHLQHLTARRELCFLPLPSMDGEQGEMNSPPGGIFTVIVVRNAGCCRQRPSRLQSQDKPPCAPGCCRKHQLQKEKSCSCHHPSALHHTVA